MALLPHPPRIPGDPDDKVLHIIAFLTLGALGRTAFARTPSWVMILSLSLFGGVIELLQSIPTLHRDSDAIDWIADTLAAAAAVLAVNRLQRANR